MRQKLGDLTPHAPLALQIDAYFVGENRGDACKLTYIGRRNPAASTPCSRVSATKWEKSPLTARMSGT